MICFLYHEGGGAVKGTSNPAPPYVYRAGMAADLGYPSPSLIGVSRTLVFID